VIRKEIIGSKGEGTEGYSNLCDKDFHNMYWFDSWQGRIDLFAISFTLSSAPNRVSYQVGIVSLCGKTVEA
jgi:hypothetical protein